MRKILFTLLALLITTTGKAQIESIQEAPAYNPPPISDVFWTITREVEDDYYTLGVEVETSVIADSAHVNVMCMDETKVDYSNFSFAVGETGQRPYDCSQFLIFQVKVEAKDTTYSSDYEIIQIKQRQTMPITKNVSDWTLTEFRAGQMSTTVDIDAATNVSEGNLIVIGISILASNSADGIDTTNVPAGWTSHQVTTNNSDWSPNLYIYYKIAEAADVTDGTNSGGLSYTFGLKDNWDLSAWAMRFTGHDATTPLTTNKSDAVTLSGTSVGVPSISVSNGNLLVSFAGNGDFNNANVGNAMTTPSGMTKDVEHVPGAGTNGSEEGSAVATESISADGTTGTKTWSIVNSDALAGQLFEVQAASGTATDVSFSLNTSTGISGSSQSIAEAGIDLNSTQGISDGSTSTGESSFSLASMLQIALSSQSLSDASFSLPTVHSVTTSSDTQVVNEASFSLALQKAITTDQISTIDVSYSLNTAQQASVSSSSTAEAAMAVNFNAALSLLSTALAEAGISFNAVQSVTLSAQEIGTTVTLADGRTLTIKLQNRTFTIPEESRTFTIASENRTFTID